MLYDVMRNKVDTRASESLLLCSFSRIDCRSDARSCRASNLEGRITDGCAKRKSSDGAYALQAASLIAPQFACVPI